MSEEVVDVSQQFWAVITSGAAGGILSVVLTWLLSYKKFEADQQEKQKKDELNSIEFYRKKWLEDEDQIDKLRDEIRTLKDENTKK